LSVISTYCIATEIAYRHQWCSDITRSRVIEQQIGALRWSRTINRERVNRSIDLCDSEELLEGHIIVSVQRFKSLFEPVDSIIVARGPNETITLLGRICKVLELLRTSEKVIPCDVGFEKRLLND
jgi:hypothetical protein